jgi:hypothetical protein
MQPSESMAPISVSTGADAATAVVTDLEFEARWAAWRQRSIAHERAVRRTFVRLAGIAGILAIAIAYMVLQR